MSKFFVSHLAIGQDAAFVFDHVEQQVGVVLRVDAHEARLPLDGGDGARQAVLHVPEDRSAQVHVVLHQTHARVTRPALFVVVADDVLVVRIGMLGQVALDEVLGLVGAEAQQHVHAVDVAAVQAYRMSLLRRSKQIQKRRISTIQLTKPQISKPSCVK